MSLPLSRSELQRTVPGDEGAACWGEGAGAPRQSGTSAWMWCFALLLVGHAAVIVGSPHPPVLQDYPDWVYQGVLFAKLVAGHPVAGYALKHYPVPNSLTTVGVGLLSLVVGWVWAAKLWIVLVLAAMGVGCVRVVQRLGGVSDAVLPIFAASVITGMDLWTGSINFQLSLAFFLLLLAHLLRRDASGWVTAALLLLCFFTHMLPCGAGMLALGALALQERSARRLVPVLPTLLMAGWYALSHDPGPAGQSPWRLLPAAVAVGALLWWSARLPAAGRLRGAGLWALVWPPVLPRPVFLLVVKAISLLGWLGPMNVLAVGSADGHALGTLPVLWGLAGLGVAAACLGGWRLASVWVGLGRSGDPRRFVAVTALVLAVLFALAPTDALGVTGIDSRFLHLALAAGLGLLGLRASRAVTALACVAVVFGGVNLMQFAAVQFHPGAASAANSYRVVFGVSTVAPAYRVVYYEALHGGRYDQWIFPTAMFQQVR